MHFFKFESGELILDKPELALYPEFSTLIKRDKGSEGDVDGRKKKKAFAEFTYIYFTTDFGSYPNKHGFNPKQIHEYAVDMAKLPRDYKPDSEVKDAMNCYRKLVTSLSKEIRQELLKSFNNSPKIISKLRDKVDDLIIKDMVDDKDIIMLVECQKQLLQIATDIPKKLLELREVDKLVQNDEEKTNAVIRRGGGEVPFSADPANDF
jgi:hypothetical protein